jgi:hypothetical protein
MKRGATSFAILATTILRVDGADAASVSGNKPILSLTMALLSFTSVGLAGPLAAHENAEPRALEDRIIAVWIPDKPALAAFTVPGAPDPLQPESMREISRRVCAHSLFQERSIPALLTQPFSPNR